MTVSLTEANPGWETVSPSAPAHACSAPITVGDRAVVAANAVVLEDVPADCLVAGVPARVIRTRMSAPLDPSVPASTSYEVVRN